MEQPKTKSKAKSIPMWAGALIAIGAAVIAFWFFGGQNYVAHKADIDYGHFHHAEDESNPLNWFFFLLETGQLAGFVALMLAIAVVALINWRARKS